VLDPPPPSLDTASAEESAPSVSDGRAARELFLIEAVPRLVRTVGEILIARGIPVMPLKGALLQRWVYGARVFRPVSDVDVLVPPGRFHDARTALQLAGFTMEREEPGGWEVALRCPNGWLEIDLHRRLSSTARSKLSAQDFFYRGRPDSSLFGVEVILPDPRDLYAHLLLHMTLNWLVGRGLHHPGDLEAVPRAFSLSPSLLAEHLSRMGLAPHAALVLPLVLGAVEGDFTARLFDALPLAATERFAVAAARVLCRGPVLPRSFPRRAAGFMLAPSWMEAAREAILKRLKT